LGLKWKDPERFHPLVQMVRKIEQEGNPAFTTDSRANGPMQKSWTRTVPHHGAVTLFHRVSQIVITPTMHVFISYHIESDWDKTKVVQ
jgi:hypothetical protein